MRNTEVELMEKNVGLDEVSSIAETILSNADYKICLFKGEMGTGKTTLIKAICELIGVRDNVASPTFALVNEYLSKQGPVYHFDFYRLTSLEEALDAGVEEYFYSGNLCLIEWPEVIDDILPAKRLVIEIENTGNDQRNYKLTTNESV